MDSDTSHCPKISVMSQNKITAMMFRVKPEKNDF